MNDDMQKYLICCGCKGVICVVAILDPPRDCLCGNCVREAREIVLTIQHELSRAIELQERVCK